jgi:hypothetical protein
LVPYFRIERVDGTTEHAEALRVLRDIDDTVLEGRRDGEWVSQLSVPTRDVAGVYQRLTDVTGGWRWVLVNPSRSLGHRHPRAHHEHLRPGE